MKEKAPEPKALALLDLGSKSSLRRCPHRKLQPALKEKRRRYQGAAPP